MNHYESIFINQDFSFLTDEVSNPDIYLFLALFFHDIAKEENEYYSNPVIKQTSTAIMEMDDEGVEYWVDKISFEPTSYFDELISKNSTLNRLVNLNSYSKYCIAENDDIDIQFENIEDKDDARKFLENIYLSFFYDNMLSTVFNKTQEIKYIFKEQKELEKNIKTSPISKKGIKV